MKITVHEPDYEPALRGRPRRVDITDLLQKAIDHPGIWVEAEFENKDAGSVVRQLKKYEGLDFGTKAIDSDNRLVLVRTQS